MRGANHLVVFKKLLCFFILLLLILAGCSGNADESKESAQNSYDDSSAGMDMDSAAEEESVSFNDSTEKPQSNVAEETDRMVIYNAELHLQVKDFIKAQKIIEEKAAGYGGYIVESTSDSMGEERLSGRIVIRMPEKHFQTFIHDAEETAFKVTNRRVSGVDVKEEYVDLESRLKSKRAVEERLLDFMKDAKETEDLLKISTDLAMVQEEIERIVGRQKYLENQSALSTITIYLSENKVVVPSLENENLNTWEKIKRQFATSINWVLSFFSGFAILIFGNLPIIIIITMIAIPLFLYIRKRLDKKPNDIDSNSTQ